MYVQLEDLGTIDPRVARTRQLLINSFAELLVQHKSIRAVSVQNVTALAGVNRSTFYAHFTDKYELLDVWQRLLFRQLVREKLPANARLNHNNLELLITMVLDYFTLRGKYRKRINQQFEPMMETVIQQELKAMLIAMLEETPDTQPGMPIENTASFLSWAIFGSALNWSHAKRQSKESIAQELVSMVEIITSQASKVSRSSARSNEYIASTSI
jgi:AcrR family transcriptional regulator